VTDPILSVVTGTRNRPESIARMTRSVLAHTIVPFELLIGDASDDGSRFASDDPRVHVHREAPPLGPPRGYNALFQRTRGTWVCFLNDDLEVRPGWAEAILAAAARHPTADLLCLPVVEPGYPAPLVLLYLGIPYACMGAIRRDAGQGLGWFDEGYEFYATDPDFSLRLISAGREMAPVPGAHVVHHRIADELRVANRGSFERDNARLGRRWHARRHVLRRQYRRSSFRNFRGLETLWCEPYRTRALELPIDAGQPARRVRYPHRVKAHGWWLGI
jgi:GT2 family glycosyltransferase